MPNIIETADAAAGTSTSYALTAGQTARGNLSPGGDHDWYKVTLTAGQTYTFAMLGTGTNNVQDPILRLHNPNGTNSGIFDDDTFVGQNSIFSYTATVSGTFYLEAAAKNDAGTGQYGITFGTAAKLVFDEEMGGGSIDSDKSWSAPGTSATITFGFRQSAPSYTQNITVGTPPVSVDELTTFTQVTSKNVQAAVRAILKGFEDVAGLTFVDVNPTGLTDNATILIGNYNFNDNAGAFAYFPGTTTGGSIGSTAASSNDGDLWLNMFPGGVNASNIGLGSYSYQTVMHELGHALGLSHPGAYNAAPGVAITYGANAQFQQDSYQYSNMSYFDETSTGASYNSPGINGYPSGLQLYDIYELQKIYGVNTTTRTGADRYGFGTTAGDQYDFGKNPNAGYAIWDAGGIDTIDASQFATNQTIDLGQGKFSNIGPGIGNLAIAYGAVIENAVGGSGVDTITGNDADNRLEGGAGGDTIDGGAGRDTVSYHGSRARVNVDLSRLAPGPDQYLPRGGDALGDTLISIENIIGSDHDDRLVGVAFGTQGSEVSGGWGNDTIFGTSGDDTLHGGGTNLVRNGSFDLNDSLTAESAGYFLAGSVDSWAVSGAPQIELFTSASGSTPRTGTYAVDLSANPGKTKIAQTVQGVQDGVLYRLAFDARALSGSGAKVRISFDGVGCGTIKPTTSWAPYFVDVYGNRGSGADLNQLTFQEVGASDFNGTQLDNVRMFDASLSDPIYDGNDFIVSNGGNDVVYGDGGDDTFHDNGLPSGSFTQQYDGGSGNDKLAMDWSAATWSVRYMAPSDLPAAPTIGAAAAYATGEHFDDRLYFRDVEVFDLTGGSGDDLLVGGAQNDALHGGAGNDVLNGNGGIDVIDGGAGIDRAILDTSALSGVHIVVADMLGGGTVTLSNGTQLTSIENVDLVAGNGDDYLDVRGTVPYDPGAPWVTAQSTTFSGHGGNDTLAVDIATSFGASFDGGAGDADLLIMDWSGATSTIDLIDRGTPSAYYASYAWTYTYQDPEGHRFSHDYYFTVGFTDVERFDLTGGQYADHLYGGAGDDVLNPGTGFGDVVDGDAGTDTLKVRWAAGGDFGYSTPTWGGNATDGYSGTYTTGRSDRNQVTFANVEKFDLVLGGSDDTIQTGDFDDIVAGNGGNDTFRTGKGIDTIDGGNGNDRWQADKSDATNKITIDLTAVSSTYKVVKVPGVPVPTATVTGIEMLGGSDAVGDGFATGSGADTIVTTSGFFADYIETNGGDDTVTVAGGFGDVVKMGDGTDTLKVRWATGGDFGYSTPTWGGNATDGYSGTYTTGRSDRNQVTFANVEKFDLVLGESDNSIRTGDFDDVVVGNAGNDTFRTGKGADTIAGGDGNDRWQADKSDATNAITIDLTANSSTYKVKLPDLPATATATVTSIEMLGGSDADGDGFATGSGADTIVTTSGFFADYIETNGGNDTVTVAGGFGDVVMMGDGTDTLNVLWATGGDFGYSTTGWAGNAVDGYSGTYTTGRADRNQVTFESVEKFDVVLGKSDDTIRTGDFDDSVVGHAGNDTFRTGKGIDTIDGGNGNDRWQADKSDATNKITIDLTANSSTYKVVKVPGVPVPTAAVTGIEMLGGSDAVGDRFATGSGDDTIVTTSGFFADYMETNGGDDTVTVAGGFGDVVEMGGGIDTLRVRWAGDFGYSTSGWAGNATDGYSGTYTTGRSDRNQLTFDGVEKFDLVLGDGGDSIRTGDFDDIVVGNGGNDTLRTGKGADTIDGGDGNDRWQADDSTATNAITIDLTAPSWTYTIDGIDATVTSIEALGVGDADGDRFATGSKADTIVTGSGFYADFIDTDGGNDKVTVAGGFGDVVRMGDGTDTLRVRWATGGDFGYSTADWTDNAADGYSGTYTTGRSDRNQVTFANVEKFDLVLGDSDDSIRTGDFNDSVVGNGGNDAFRTGKGADTIEGGDGNDRWQADNSTVTNAIAIDITAASWTYTIDGVDATVTGIEMLGVGDADSDCFATGSQADTIVTGSGFFADYIETNGGDDTVTVAGGFGDVVKMGDGTDTLKVRWATGGDFGYSTPTWGGNATDGYSGTYTTGRSDRNQVTFANVEKFDLVLGESDDSIRTGDFDDSVVGNAGNDTLRTGKGADTVDGGGGNDRWQADKSDAANALKINLTAASSKYKIAGVAATVTSIEALGVGDADGDRFATGSGADTIVTTSGFFADYIETDGGNDTVTVAGGFGDIVRMGGGTDTLRVRWAGGDFGYSTSGWAGNATDGYSGTYTTGRGDRNQVTFDGVEKFDLVLGESNDTIQTGDFNDIINGGGGADQLLGQGGNDRLIGGTGGDAMFGGAGNDLYYVDDLADVVREDTVAGVDDGGTDSVYSSVSFTLGAFVEKLTLTGSDAIDGTGNGLDNGIKGNSGSTTCSVAVATTASTAAAAPTSWTAARATTPTRSMPATSCTTAAAAAATASTPAAPTRCRPAAASRSWRRRPMRRTTCR